MKCITMETIKETELNATKKAELISIGSVQVDKSLFPDQLKSTGYSRTRSRWLLNFSQIRKQTGETYN